MAAESIILRSSIILLLIIRTIYWRISEKKALNKKPKKQKRTSAITFHIIIRNSLNIIVFIQLLGVRIMPFNHGITTELLGSILCVIAVVCSILGRKALGVNWTDSAEAQIKTRHSLVTYGIYKYIRHPIAVGYCCFIIGAELFVGSWLVTPMAIGLFAGAYVQSKTEETILRQAFGKEYKDYMQKTKMFVPYIW